MATAKFDEDKFTDFIHSLGEMTQAELEDAYDGSTDSPRPKRPLSCEMTVRRKKLANGEAMQNLPPLPDNDMKLSREECLTASSREYENIIRSVTRYRELNDVELEEVKRTRRLIKNRESAAVSRLRRKEHTTKLQRMALQLTAEVVALKARISALDRDNDALRNQLEAYSITAQTARPRGRPRAAAK
jgi:hypothetical protein